MSWNAEFWFSLFIFGQSNEEYIFILPTECGQMLRKTGIQKGFQNSTCIFFTLTQSKMNQNSTT